MSKVNVFDGLSKGVVLVEASPNEGAWWKFRVKGPVGSEENACSVRIPDSWTSRGCRNSSKLQKFVEIPLNCRIAYSGGFPRGNHWVSKVCRNLRKPQKVC